MKKYELTEESIVLEGTTLFRIRALREFGFIRAGDRGGFVQSEYNLSHDGVCWVFNNACVFGESRVSGDAIVSGYTVVSGNATICGNITITGTTEWTLDWEEFHNKDFFNSGLTINDAVIGTRADFLREFPEWCI